MSAATDLRDYLLELDEEDGSDLVDLIGSRLYPDALPQSPTLPAVVYYVISGTTLPGLAGIVADGEMRVQFDAYSLTRLESDEVAAAIAAMLKSLSAAGPTTIGDGTPVCDVEVMGPRHDRQPPADGSDQWTYITSIDAVLTLAS